MADQKNEALQEDARALLERMRQAPPREPGEKLRPADEVRILDLAAKGLTQIEIAAQVGCHQSTVSRTLAEYDDTRPLARKHLEARALDLSRRFVSEARPSDIARMLAKLDVIRDDGATGGGDSHSMVVILGSGGVKIDALQPDDIIVLDQALPSVFGESDARLRVRRRNGGGGSFTEYDLPCPVSELPPDTKIEPDALAYIRNGCRLLPAIDVEAKTCCE